MLGKFLALIMLLLASVSIVCSGSKDINVVFDDIKPYIGSKLKNDRVIPCHGKASMYPNIWFDYAEHTVDPSDRIYNFQPNIDPTPDKNGYFTFKTDLDILIFDSNVAGEYTCVVANPSDGTKRRTKNFNAQ